MILSHDQYDHVALGRSQSDRSFPALHGESTTGRDLAGRRGVYGAYVELVRKHEQREHSGE